MTEVGSRSRDLGLVSEKNNKKKKTPKLAKTDLNDRKHHDYHSTVVPLLVATLCNKATALCHYYHQCTSSSHQRPPL